MYRHIKSYELRYTDVDAFDNLKLSSLLSFLEESACLSADELGFGYEEVSSKNLGFIIVNLYIKLERNIKLGEIVTIQTWPLKPRLLIFLRESEIYVGDEKVGVATARWFMVNTKTFQPSPASAFFEDGAFDNYNTQRSVEFSNWKIPALTDGKKVYSKLITYSDYDHYFHANNTKYADFLLDAFSVEELKERDICSVQITYAKQCKEGETIDIFRFDDGMCSIIEGRVGNELRVQMRVEFDRAKN